MNLKQITERIAKLIQERQKKLAPRNTGALAGSIKTFVDILRDKITISTKMFDYGWDQDSGVQGVKERINKNPQSFQPPRKFSGKFKMIGPVSFAPWGDSKKSKSKSAAIRTSIYNKGIEPQPFIVPATNQVMDSVGYKLLANKIAENVVLEFKKL